MTAEEVIEKAAKLKGWKMHSRLVEGWDGVIRRWSRRYGWQCPVSAALGNAELDTWHGRAEAGISMRVRDRLVRAADYGDPRKSKLRRLMEEKLLGIKHGKG